MEQEEEQEAFKLFEETPELPRLQLHTHRQTETEHTLLKRFYASSGGCVDFCNFSSAASGRRMCGSVAFYVPSPSCSRSVVGSRGRPVHIFTQYIDEFIGLWFICRCAANEF